jgi:FAD-dependent urate hydroxylase
VTRESLVEVAIIGAGPYGLAISSMLSDAGVDHRIFGAPMQTWRRMPVGMCLKSIGFATTIPSPKPGFEFPDFCRRQGVEDFEPVPTSAFVEYGDWFQRELIPHLEQRLVEKIRRAGEAFELILSTGEVFQARKVVVATGLTQLAHIPAGLASLPRAFVSHSSARREYAEFRGRDVVVVGRGQSALEAAALLHDAGARVQVLTRRPVEWSVPFDRNRPLWKRILRPNTSIGASPVSWLMEQWPLLLHRAPAPLRLHMVRTYLGPAGAWWLRDRVEGCVAIDENARQVAAVPTGDRLRVTITTTSGARREMEADHIVAGTGYRADLDRMDFIGPDLGAQLRRIEMAPDLSRHCESSVEGLYFVGPVSAPSFGPLMRFVAGAPYTAPTVARHLRQSLSARSATVRTVSRGSTRTTS